MTIHLRSAKDKEPLPFDELALGTRDGGAAVCACRPFQCGDAVFRFDDAERRSQRDWHTVEAPDGSHLYHPVLALTAHGCDPNCRIDLHDRVMVALRPIEPGEAITYDYETTERWFSHPFWCQCGARRCRGRIG
jgi:uncharacterized protein